MFLGKKSYLYIINFIYRIYLKNLDIQMRNYLVIIAWLVLSGAVLSGCNGLSRSSKMMSTDSVAIKSICLADTSYFPLTTGGKCDIFANVQIAYPESYLDGQSTKQLQRLFARSVLEVSDSISFDEIFESYITNIMHQYGVSDNEKPEDVEDDYESVYQYASNTSISPVYNCNKILSFCKTEVTKKNGKQTMLTHRYYNFDLTTMKRIEYNDLFLDSSMEDVAAIIKKVLVKQMNVKNEEELINLGYFNLDNLRATNNFCIGKDGVTWTYLPYEIALLSVGETNVTVSYDDLDMLMQDNDLTARLR